MPVSNGNNFRDLEIYRLARSLAALIHSITLTSEDWPDASASSLRKSSKFVVNGIIHAYQASANTREVKRLLVESANTVENMLQEMSSPHVLAQVPPSERSILLDSYRSMLETIRSLRDLSGKDWPSESGAQLNSKAEEGFFKGKTGRLDLKVIVITRPLSQSAPVVEMIEALGGVPVLIPMIEIVDPDNWEHVDKTIVRFKEFDGVIFTSQNAVDRTTTRIDAIEPEAKRMLASRRVYAVGEKTRLSLEKAQIPVTLIPERYSANDLLASLLQESLAGKRFLFVRGNLANADLPRSMRAAGAMVDEIEVYKTIGPSDKSFEPLKQAFRQGEIDAIAFFSPSGVQNFSRVIGGQISGQCNVACIGPSTAREAERAGFRAIVTAREATAESLVYTLLSVLNDDADTTLTIEK
jgi:uroporphyrinogen-III synthase